MSNSQNNIIPGAFEVSEITLINYAGERIDIQNLVTELVVNESIYSMFCTYELTVVDGTALLERYAITGNERIELIISKKDAQNGPDIFTEKKLIVTGIREYGRVTNESQVYIIEAVSETAMHSSAKRVSKSVNGSLSRIIQDLYSEIQYEMPLSVLDETTEGNYKILLPNYTYTDTMAMLLNKTQNSTGTTFHMFENFWGNETLTSYAQIISREPVDTYRMVTNEESERSNNYDEVRTKVRGVKSNIGASHFDALKTGGLISRVFVNDIANKQLSATTTELLSSGIVKMDVDHMLADTYTIADNSLPEIGASKHFMINKNSDAFGGIDNLSNRVDGTMAIKRMQFENQYALSHDIVLVGDSRLQAGNTIVFEMPTPTDPKFITESKDEYFSGTYFISSVRHTLSNSGSYVVDLTIRRDSVNRKKMSDKYRGLE